MDIERLRQDVEALAGPRGRMAGTAGHEAARRYLERRMEQEGLAPYAGDAFALPYEAGGQRLVNLVGEVAGTHADLEPLVFVAHYDTCGVQPGADDNAAAIAILLAIIAPVRALGLNRSVVFAHFDAEEPPWYLSPAMGSVHWYHHQRADETHCAVVLDLCGHDVPVPGLEDVLFITGMESDPGLQGVLREHEPAGGVRIVPTLNRYIGDMSDHHVWRVNQRPYLFMSCGHWPHYHQPSDTPDKLNYRKMAAIAAYLVNLASALDPAPLDGPFEGADTVETELYFLKKAAGPLLDAFGFEPRTRADIDITAHTLIHQFGL